MNILKLKAKIVEKGWTIACFCEKIGISAASFYRKINNDGDSFTIGDAQKIVSVLELSWDDAKDIFFAKQVS